MRVEVDLMKMNDEDNTNSALTLLTESDHDLAVKNIPEGQREA